MTLNRVINGQHAETALSFDVGAGRLGLSNIEPRRVPVLLLGLLHPSNTPPSVLIALQRTLQLTHLNLVLVWSPLFRDELLEYSRTRRNGYRKVVAHDIMRHN